jgi:pimeloyl-ACP methyl ester carboxylesterase
LLKIKIENLVVEKIHPEKIRHDYPLLFIHGAGGTSQYWQNYLPYFADKGWAVFAMNLRGHFPSDREEALVQVTLEDYLDDVEKVIHGLDMKGCALIGHSLGGLIAQKTAENIDSIKALVTLASAPPFGVTAMDMNLNMNHDLPYSGQIIKTMWGMMNMKPVKPTFMLAEKTVLNNIAPEERQTVFDMFVAESLYVGYQVAQGFPVYPSQIKCPKLVIGCVKDVLAPVSMQKNLADFLKADYMEYQQFAHLPMLEAGWKKSADDIQNWLRKKVEG